MELLARGTASLSFHRILRLFLVPGVVGVLVPPGARPPVVLKDVALPALAAVAAHGVDTDVFAQRLVAGATLIDVQAVGLLPLPVSLTVILVSWITGAQHSAEVICTLLFTGSLGTNIIIFWDTLSKNKLIPFAALFPETRREFSRRLQTGIFGCGNFVFRADFSVKRLGGKKVVGQRENRGQCEPWDLRPGARSRRWSPSAYAERTPRTGTSHKRTTTQRTQSPREEKKLRKRTQGNTAPRPTDRASPGCHTGAEMRVAQGGRAAYRRPEELKRAQLCRGFSR